MTIKLHISSYGTYHPDPTSNVAWTVNDTRGYVAPGPLCDECDACECGTPQELGECPCQSNKPVCHMDAHHRRCTYKAQEAYRPNMCIGLSFTYICLDGGEALCESCAEAEGLEIKDCDCN